MALTKCVKCDRGLFELKELRLTGTKFKYAVVQCSGCGTPVGPMDFMNIGAEIAEVKQELDELKAQVKKVLMVASNIDHNVVKLGR